jgi:hypothetical protein
MARTTIDVDAVVLRELKKRARSERKSLGRVASELLAQALRADPTGEPRQLEWSSAPMVARVDLEDKEALRQALEGR